MTLIEKISAAELAVELIGYREDAERLPVAEQAAALHLIQDKFESLRRHSRRRVFVPEKTKSIKNLFGKHTQVSDVTDPDYGNPMSPFTAPYPPRKRKSKR